MKNTTSITETTQNPIPIETGQVASAFDVSFIASSLEYPFLQTDRALPLNVDDAERDFGLDIYDRMANEPILAGIEAALKISTIADGLTIEPGVEMPPDHGATPEQVADYEQALEIADFVRYCVHRLGRVDKPILSICWNLMDAIRKGHKLAEVTYGQIENGKYKGKAGIDSIRPKPRENYSFIVDQDNTFRGVMAKIPGVSLVVRVGMIGDASLYNNVVAPEKLLVLTLDDKDSDPRGKSWYRRAYDPWYRKQVMKPEHLKTGVQFGGGMITAVAPEKNEQSKVMDPVTGLPTRLSNAITTALSQLKNGGTATFPFGTVVTVHTPKADCKFFTDSFNYADIEMATAILLSAQAILEAKHSSKSSSGQGQDLLDEVKIHCRNRICDLLTYKLFYNLVAINYGVDTAEQFCPIATMQRASTPDFAANATAVAALQQSGYLDPSQLKATDSKILGLPPRVEDNPESDEEDDDTAAMAVGFPRTNKGQGSNRRRLQRVEQERKAEIAQHQQ